MSEQLMKWDVELAFMLFCLGATQQEIGDKFDITQQAVSVRAIADRWDERKEDYLRERLNRTGNSVSKEQQFIKSMECDISRRLLGLGHEMLRTLTRSPKTDVADLCRVLDLASTLGRRATGLPMQAIEITQVHDIAEDVKRMLDKAYGEPASPVIDAVVVPQLPEASKP